jgi:hypothetical protein
LGPFVYDDKEKEKVEYGIRTEEKKFTLENGDIYKGELLVGTNIR